MDEERKPNKTLAEEINEATAILEPAFREYAKQIDEAVQRIADVIRGALETIGSTQYLLTEVKHPRKKPRGTKRRKRQGRL